MPAMLTNHCYQGDCRDVMRLSVENVIICDHQEGLRPIVRQVVDQPRAKYSPKSRAETIQIAALGSRNSFDNIRSYLNRNGGRASIRTSFDRSTPGALQNVAVLTGYGQFHVLLSDRIDHGLCPVKQRCHIGLHRFEES